MSRKLKSKEKTDTVPKPLEAEKPETGGPHLVRGMKDIVPAEQKYWEFVSEAVKKTALDYGFEKIDTPILEPTSLFVRSVGKETDIVEKEMYAFVDKGGDAVTLRPENTPAVVRAYLEHGFVNKVQPVKLYYFAPFFRYCRPQAGRMRQFWQLGFEVLGDNHPVLDAWLIDMCYSFYQEIGLKVSIQVNSIGCPNCRENYRQVLIDYYQPKKKFLCEDCKRRLVKNPLRLLDCKEENCREIAVDSPQIIDYLCEECRDHFMKVLEYLDGLDLSYTLNPQLVRGLDYYTKTTFELWSQDDEGGKNSLGGGGRYDNLSELLGGRPLPACGFAGGVERLIAKLKELNVTIPDKSNPEIFLAQLGVSARKKCLKLFKQLRQEQIKVAEAFSKDSIKSQLQVAAGMGAKYALILGQKEVMDGTIIIRDMENGIQEIVDFNKILPEIKRRRARKLEQNGEVKELKINPQLEFSEEEDFYVPEEENSDEIM